MIEEHHVEVEKENMKLYDLKEEQKKLVEEEKKKISQAILKVQHDEFKQKHIKRMQEEKIRTKKPFSSSCDSVVGTIGSSSKREQISRVLQKFLITIEGLISFHQKMLHLTL